MRATASTGCSDDLRLAVTVDITGRDANPTTEAATVGEELSENGAVLSAENADMLRRRMKQSRSLVFLTTKSSISSRWMPWELGYFDGLKTGFIGILPIVDYSGGSFSGQEYLALYPLVERLPLTGGGTRFCVVERAGKGYRFLDDFVRGQATIRAFNS